LTSGKVLHGSIEKTTWSLEVNWRNFLAAGASSSFAYRSSYLSQGMATRLDCRVPVSGSYVSTTSNAIPFIGTGYPYLVGPWQVGLGLPAVFDFNVRPAG
jgi:hypothetical protein